MTNIPGLAETSRKKGGERFALSRSIKQAMTDIKTLSTQAGLSQGPGPLLAVPSSPTCSFPGMRCVFFGTRRITRS